jgi:SNF2 family DNA or RNA helicase
VFQLRRRLSANRETPIWILTGTPIVNNPGDLYPLFHLWKSRDYKSYWKFVDRWCDVVVTPWAKEVRQIRKGVEAEFQEVMSEFTLRRTLKDVPKLASLDEYHKHHFVSMPASVRKMIAKAKKEYILEHSDLDETEFLSGSGALYARLCQLATNPPTSANPKVELCLDFLQDHPGRVVVYTWYKDSAQAVAARLGKAGRPVYKVTGDTPSEARQGIVDEWTTSNGGILVATIASLKEGISLVASNSVLFLEHSPLPADQEQCVARLKRRGQTETVGVHHVWARGTPDTAIKRAVFDREEGLDRALTSWLLADEA